MEASSQEVLVQNDGSENQANIEEEEQEEEEEPEQEILDIGIYAVGQSTEIQAEFPITDDYGNKFFIGAKHTENKFESYTEVTIGEGEEKFF